MKNSIFIETNGNDYMTYFEQAASAMRIHFKERNGESPLFKNIELHKITRKIAEDTLREIFLEFTNTFYKLSNREGLNFINITGMRNEIEIYLNDEAIEKALEYNKDDSLSNGSHIFINIEN